MHAHPRAAAGDDQGIDAQRHQRRLQRLAVDRIAQHQAFGAVAAIGIHILVQVRDLRAGIVRRGGRGLHAHRARAALDVFGDAFQPVDEAARAGIDHPGLLQHRHLPRRIRQCVARPLQCAGEAGARIVAAGLARGLVERIGERGDDAEDGALHRLGQCAACTVRAPSHRGGQRPRIQHRCVARLLGQADEELRHDRAGIAARAIDGVVADAREQFADVPAAPAQRTLQHVAEGRGEVVAGIAVGHREHVDAI